ncbi:hypothetical protein ACOMHN_060782 [Nucella lapillus]
MPGTQKCTTNYLGGCTHEKKKNPSHLNHWANPCGVAPCLDDSPFWYPSQCEEIWRVPLLSLSQRFMQRSSFSPFTAGDGNPLSVPEQSVTSWALLSGYQGPQFGKSAGNAEEEEEISSLGACCAS